MVSGARVRASSSYDAAIPRQAIIWVDHGTQTQPGTTAGASSFPLPACVRQAGSQPAGTSSPAQQQQQHHHQSGPSLRHLLPSCIDPCGIPPHTPNHDGSRPASKRAPRALRARPPHRLTTITSVVVTGLAIRQHTPAQSKMSLPPRRTPATPATNRTPATTRKTPAKTPAQPLRTQPPKTPALTGPAPNVLKGGTSNATPPKGYGYTPSYVPPRPDSPSLEEVVQAFQEHLHLTTDVEIPEVMQVTTMEDLVQRILSTCARRCRPGGVRHLHACAHTHVDDGVSLTVRCAPCS